ncbi:MAG: hypothetical protein M1823_001486 [Watsoniomyces obsoletus]|nr:MAG: hypothetical protein M1823_001486 [Watsoniomyces obsoletus]
MSSVAPQLAPVEITMADVNGRTLLHQPSISSFPPTRTTSAMSKAPSYEMPAVTPNRNSHGSGQTASSTDRSHQSQLGASYSASNGASRSKRLKSQYPRESGENHVEYILVASFDIDRGPIMENQYPGAIKGDQHMLAELMLPDQTHVRNEDWTIFFLHKDTSGDRPDDAGRRRRRHRKEAGTDEEDGEGSEVSDEEEDEADEEVEESDEEDDAQSDGSKLDSDEDEDEEEDDDDDDEGGPPLVYVLNLVNTKQDPLAKRGATVKAMAICTRHSFLHIYKPLLLLALDDYFKSPHPETLATLYDAVNSMDLSLMPRLSVFERYILQASDTKDLFIEKFTQMIKQRMEDDEESAEGVDAPSSPGKAVEARPRTVNGTHRVNGSRYSLPRDTHEFETQVWYNNFRIPVKVPTAPSPETVGDFSLIKLIQAFSTPHAKDPQPFMLHSHLTTGGAYTHPIIVLANAMLTQKRVIFLGHNRPSGEVAEAVLAACALASGGILRGFTRHAFPYTDLSKIEDLLKVSGFVAGVTNPAFANHPQWWDLLCDITTGRMKISANIEPAPLTEGLINFQQHLSHVSPSNASSSSSSAQGNVDPTGDQAFIDDVLRSIASRHGEAVIRAKWRDWVIKFTRVAAAFEESVYGASALWIGGEEAGDDSAGLTGHGYVWSDEISRQRELAGSVSRIEGWRNTRSYYSFIQDLAHLYSLRPIKSLDLHHLYDRLRTQKLSPSESAAIYLALSAQVHSYPEICQLLTVTPESHAGLFYLSLGLFHPEPEVRARTGALLGRIREHTAGRHFWNSLNAFAKLAFVRQRKGSVSGRAEQDEDRAGGPSRLQGEAQRGRATA